MKLQSKFCEKNLERSLRVICSTNQILFTRAKNYLKVFSVGLILLMMASFILKDEPKFEIKGMASDKKYGYTENNPIKVGGGASAGHHFIFLQHLRGPNGEKLEVKRLGSCGTYPNPDTTLTKFNEGVLTCFSINCSSFKKPKVLYFDKYRTGDLYIPKELTWVE